MANPTAAQWALLAANLLVNVVVPPQPAPVTTTYLNAMNVAASVSGDAITLAVTHCPNVGGRNVTITPVDAAAGSPILSGTVTVIGYDQFGTRQTEVIAFSASTAAAGLVCFQDLVSANITTIAGNGVGDTLSLGFGDVVGIRALFSNDLHEIKAFQRELANAVPTQLTISTTLLDTTNMAIKLGGSGGSGAIVAGDSFTLALAYDRNIRDAVYQPRQ